MKVVKSGFGVGGFGGGVVGGVGPESSATAPCLAKANRKIVETVRRKEAILLL